MDEFDQKLVRIVVEAIYEALCLEDGCGNISDLSLDGDQRVTIDGEYNLTAVAVRILTVLGERQQTDDPDPSHDPN